MRSVFAIKFHADGTATLWNVYTQQWERTGSPGDQLLASLPVGDREQVLSHCGSYRFATDAETGAIMAQSFEAACEQLKAMVTDSDGGWGWVQDHDGYRYEVEAE